MAEKHTALQLPQMWESPKTPIRVQDSPYNPLPLVESPNKAVLSSEIPNTAAPPPRFSPNSATDTPLLRMPLFCAGDQ